MELTKKQREGLQIALDRYKNGYKYTTIAGYAGTGKSTLVKFIIDALGTDSVVYATFTGKAAEVLRKKGNSNAMTLHRLLYDSVPKKEGGYIHKPKEELEYEVVVVDEVSMAPISMLDLLLSHNVYAIFLGDPFQLPQIDKNQAHTLLDNPHIFLDEVMRQAAESEIIQLTMKIRNNEPIDYFKGKDVMIIPNKDLVTGHLSWADQIICGTNNTRASLNNQMRDMLGYSGAPQTGERMICTRNYWDDFSVNGDAVLVNGITGTIENPFLTYRRVPRWVKTQVTNMECYQCEFIDDEGRRFHSVEMDKQMIETGKKCIDWKDSYRLGTLKYRLGDIVPREFQYGYAITCHKSQGSEWNNVLVIEESFPFEKLEHARWLYTACTRAAEKLILVR